MYVQLTSENPAKRSFSKEAIRKGRAKFCNVTAFMANRACDEIDPIFNRDQEGGCYELRTSSFEAPITPWR
jgi:hypothetical protein